MMDVRFSGMFSLACLDDAKSLRAYAYAHSQRMDFSVMWLRQRRIKPEQLILALLLATWL